MEVHKTSHCRGSWEDQATATGNVFYTKNVVKFGRVVLTYASGHTDRQTKQTNKYSDMFITILFRTSGLFLANVNVLRYVCYML